MANPVSTAKEDYLASVKSNSAKEIKPSGVVAAQNQVQQRQPFVAEDQKLKSAQDAIAKLQIELEKAKKEIDDLKNKETAQKKSSDGVAATSAKTKNTTDPNIETVLNRE